VRAQFDENKYPKAVKVSDAQLAAVNLSRHSFHGDWNYAIVPSQPKPRRRAIDRISIASRHNITRSLQLPKRFPSLHGKSACTLVETFNGFARF
jgi:hypothetical protein